MSQKGGRTLLESSQSLSIEVDGPVRVVTLQRAERLNAVDKEMHGALAAVWSGLEADIDARAVILTGAGKAFCAGGDAEWFREIRTDVSERRRAMREARRIALEMVRFPLPVIAAVNGPAVGLGCSLAVLADHVLMADLAYFADPHVAIGVAAGDGGAAAWPLYTNLLRAKEYIFSGRRIPADLAVELGLANAVVPTASLLDRAREIAHDWAKLPFAALQDTKRALNMHLERAMSGVLEFALASESEHFTSEEHAAWAESFRNRQ